MPPVKEMKVEQVLNPAQVHKLQGREYAFKFSEKYKDKPAEKDFRPPQADDELIMRAPLTLSFDERPLFIKQYTGVLGEAHSLLPNLFTTYKIKPDVSFKGRLLIDKKKKGYFEAVEGLEVSVNIKTY